MSENDTIHPDYLPLPYRVKNISNQTFGRLTALGLIDITPTGRTIWFCQCACGGTVSARSDHLRGGVTKSCGCLEQERRERKFTPKPKKRRESRATGGTTKIRHGMSYSSLYRVWQHMTKRCRNPKDDHYPSYGGRGIIVCDEWRHSFQTYHDYVTRLPDYGKESYTLDRIDNNGDYEPGNVRWATKTEQARNTRQNQMITFDGKTQCISAWAVEIGMNRKTLDKRLKSGWSVEMTLTTPVDATYSRPRK